MLPYLFYFAQPQHTKSRPTYNIANNRNSILHTIYTEKGAITGI